MTRIAFILMLLFSSSAVSAAEGAGTERSYKVHVIIVGPGDELFARFGHIALMVEDDGGRPPKVYNFGTFDFTDPNLRLKYARGFLTYWLSVDNYETMVHYYRSMNRSMVVRTLSLTNPQAETIARKLEINALPENREYAYRHYLDNCCTRIRDILDETLGGAIRQGRNEKPTGRTFRYWTERALKGLPVVGSMILFSLGPAIDRPITRWEEEFLPEVLGEDLDATHIGPRGETPLVAEKIRVLERRGAPVGQRTDTLDLVVIYSLTGFLLIAFGIPLVVGRKRALARLAGLGLVVWGLVAGLGGLLLILFWAVTTHYDTHYNENLLVMPVTHLALLYPAVVLLFKAEIKERLGRVLGWYLVVSLGVIALDALLKAGPFFQGNWGVIALATLCDLVALIALKRVGAIPAMRKA